MASSEWTEMKRAEGDSFVYLKEHKNGAVTIASCKGSQPEVYNMITMGREQLLELAKTLEEKK